ncbi:MAG: PadR family transcriptional regulator [Candidatus Aramenus sulfurataquae]|jgi:PadR family transcriptional regulator PadR|uniref:PadR family transcriptional regulator n=4 Tax=Candidatus Aramenus sulfurataquae TaxID=1326980 RepID=A0AAE3FJ47_9CREN|nr:PadR family transcriptional regulator [Candidatus Aramenus sulfurataquae]
MNYKETPKMMVLKGLLQIIVCYILYRYGDMYGYQIKKRLEEINKRRLPQGLIYVTLKRMVNNGIIESYNSGGKKYYRLTEGGKAFLFNHVEVLKKFQLITAEILGYLEEYKLKDSKPNDSRS